MKRGSLFMIAFLSAATCFASLMFFVGPERSGWNHYGHGNWHHRHHHFDEHYEHYYNDSTQHF